MRLCDTLFSVIRHLFRRFLLSKKIPTDAMISCSQIAECSLFYKNEVNLKRCFHVFRTVFPVVRRRHAKKRGDNLL